MSACIYMLHAKYKTKWDNLSFSEMDILSRSTKSVLLYFLRATLVFRHSKNLNVAKCQILTLCVFLSSKGGYFITYHHLIDKLCHIALFSNEYVWLVCLESVSLGGSSTVICHYTGLYSIRTMKLQAAYSSRSQQDACMHKWIACLMTARSVSFT